MILSNLKEYNIILASQSPRRKELLRNLGINFNVFVKKDIDESFPSHLKREEIAGYLANQKTKKYKPDLSDNDLIITADTIVWLNDEVLNKPVDYNDAFQILRKLSGKIHLVITGVCISTKLKTESFTSTTEVHFKQLDDSEIEYYIKNYKPYDKAGAYGIQEWIGYIGIDHIEGSYFNVMGLPLQKLYEKLKGF